VVGRVSWEKGMRKAAKIPVLVIPARAPKRPGYMPMKEKKSCERHGQVLASGSEGRVKLGEGVNVCGRQSRASHIQLKRSASRAMCMLGAALLIPDGSRTFLGNTERYAELMSDMRLGAHHQREMDGWMDALSLISLSVLGKACLLPRNRKELVGRQFVGVVSVASR